MRWLPLWLILLAALPVTAIQCWISDDTGVPLSDTHLTNSETVYCTGEADQPDPPLGFPVIDIYIMPNRTWTGGEALVDCMDGQEQVTCTGGAGAFFGVAIALPPLPDGVYDVILDEGQDGIYNAGTDFVLGEGSDWAFEVGTGIGVTMPSPPVSRPRLLLQGDLLTIEGLTPGSVVGLWDLMGRMRADARPTEGRLAFSVAGLPDGLYWVQTGSSSQKIIIIR